MLLWAGQKPAFPSESPEGNGEKNSTSRAQSTSQPGVRSSWTFIMCGRWWSPWHESKWLLNYRQCREKSKGRVLAEGVFCLEQWNSCCAVILNSEEGGVIECLLWARCWGCTSELLSRHRFCSPGVYSVVEKRKQLKQVITKWDESYNTWILLFICFLFSIYGIIMRWHGMKKEQWTKAPSESWLDTLR